LFLFDLEWRGAGGVKLARLAHSLRHREQTPVMLVAATKSARARAVLARKAGAAECVMKTQDMAGVTESNQALAWNRQGLGSRELRAGN
jgi:DNA-binding response OmpR family regulator